MRIALLLLVAWVPSLALADAVGPPPADCPEGSTAVDTCHGPETCEVADCTNDGECGAGMRCQERMLCVREHCCSGFACTMPGMGTRYTHVAGPCGAGGTCGDPSLSCSTGRVCVPDDSTPDAGGTDSGTPGSDSGAPASDSGATPMDSGSAGADGGTTSSSRGGCCSVIGARDPRVPLALLGLALVGLVARRGR